MLTYKHLLGRPFKLGDTDCFSIIRDFYRDNFGIEMTNYARPENWWDHGEDLYAENFRKEGFEIFNGHPSEWRPGDGILMAIKSKVANHAAVFVDEGLILHHLYGQLSRVDHYRGLFRNTTVAILRHKNVTYQPPSLTSNLIEMLPAHVRQKIAQAPQA